MSRITGGLKCAEVLSVTKPPQFDQGGSVTLREGSNLGAGPFDFWKGPGLEPTSSATVLSTHRNQWDCFSTPDFSLRPVPFAAPNSRLPPKIFHSLLFTLPATSTRTTLPHGRPSLGPNLEVAPLPAPSRRRSYYSTHHSPRILFSSPVICITWRQYLSRSQQLPHTSCHHRGVHLTRTRFSLPRCLPVRQASPTGSGRQIPCSQQFAASLSLFALFSTRVPFVFNRLQTLFAKHPGGGGISALFSWGAALPGGRLKLRTNNCQLLAAFRAAVVGSGCDSHAAEFVGVILAVEDVPLFAALEDLFFLRGDALADFGVGFLFFLQRGGKNLHDLLADGVAVFGEFHLVAGHQHISNLMPQPNHFFPRHPHERHPASAEGPRLYEAISKGSIGKWAFRDALTAAPACGRAPTVVSLSCTSPDSRRPCAASRPDAVSKFRALRS